MSRDWTCPDLSLGQTCLRAGNVSGPDLSWVVLVPDLSQGRRCLRAGLVSKFAAGNVQGWKCLAAGSVPNFRAGSVSRPEVSQSLGPEVSRGTWFCGQECLGANCLTMRSHCHHHHHVRFFFNLRRSYMSCPSTQQSSTQQCPEIILICSNLHKWQNKWAPMAANMFTFWIWGKQELDFD
jgi:hypothetical protein